MIPIKIPKEEKELMIEEVQAYLELDHGLTWGRLAAEQLIDFMLGQVSAPIYNRALEDARQTLLEKMASLEDDLYTLRKSPPKNR